MLIFSPSLCIVHICITLCRRLLVRGVQQILYSNENLPQCYGWSPLFILVKNTKAYRSRWIDIWMIESLIKLTLQHVIYVPVSKSMRNYHPSGSMTTYLWRLCRIVVGKFNGQRIVTILPDSALFTWNITIPMCQIHFPTRMVARYGVRIVLLPGKTS